MLGVTSFAVQKWLFAMFIGELLIQRARPLAVCVCVAMVTVQREKLVNLVHHQSVESYAGSGDLFT